MIDSQIVKTAGSAGVRGYGGGRKVKGRKRRVMVDTDGRVLMLAVHCASILNRNGIGSLVRALRLQWPFMTLGYADAGYQGPHVSGGKPTWIEIVRKIESQAGLAVHAHR